MPLQHCPYGAISKMKKPELYSLTQDLVCENIKLKEENERYKNDIVKILNYQKELIECNGELEEENEKLKDELYGEPDTILDKLKEENNELNYEIKRLKELVEGERVYRERKCDSCRCEYYLTEEDDLWVDSGTCQECS